MRLTEEEAKTKQCRATPAAIIPFVKTGQIATNPGQQGQMNYGFGLCVASQCCHWRWMLTAKLFAPDRGDGLSRVVTEPVTAPGTEQPVGYCGRAGRPD